MRKSKEKATYVLLSLMRRWWTRWQRRENESTEIYYQFKAVVRYCVLIDWVGGPDGKVSGSRLWRTDRAQLRGPSAMTENQTFCFWVRTGNSHFIEKRDICFHFCSLLSLIFCHNSGRCFLFLYFCTSAPGPGGFFRTGSSWGFPKPVKLFCSPTGWSFQKFWTFNDKTIS